MSWRRLIAAGIQAARTYLAIQPDARLVVLDANDTLGGTWAQERLYSGLHTNNQLGTFEFTDLDMIGFDGIKPGMHMTGKAVHEYLLAYVKKHKLGDRFRFKTKVVSAEWKGDRWLLDLGDKGQVETAKFIVATGLTVRAACCTAADCPVSSKHAYARRPGLVQRAAFSRA